MLAFLLILPMCRPSTINQVELQSEEAGERSPSGNEQTQVGPSPHQTPQTPAGCSLGEPATWAINCRAAAKQTCVAGSWRSVSTGNSQEPSVVSETAHFAYRYVPGLLSAEQAKSTADMFEDIWQNHIYRVGFQEPFCDSSDKHKVNITVDPAAYYASGSGTGLRDPALWLNPSALGARRALGHEFAHTLQFSTTGFRDSPFVGWMWETHAQFMTFTQPQLRTLDTAFEAMDRAGFSHLYWGGSLLRYNNYQFLDYIKDKRCYGPLNAMWADAKKVGTSGYLEEEPMQTLARSQGWAIDDINDLFGDYARASAAWDFLDPDGVNFGNYLADAWEKSYGKNADPAAMAQNRDRLQRLGQAPNRYVTHAAWAPQRWGYNIVPLTPDADAQTVTINFRGLFNPGPTDDGESDWRYGLVAKKADSSVRYSALGRGGRGTICVRLDTADTNLWLVVAATPRRIAKIKWDPSYFDLPRYPWAVEVAGAVPSRLTPEALANPWPTAGAGVRWVNGGGWVANAANVAAEAWVGPDAAVLSGRVEAGARVEDFALVLGGAVTQQATVGGLTVLGDGVTLAGTSRVATSYRPLTPTAKVVVRGNAQLLGDTHFYDEFSTAGAMTIETGVFAGLVNEASLASPDGGSRRTQAPPDPIPPGPYLWRE